GGGVAPWYRVWGACLHTEEPQYGPKCGRPPANRAARDRRTRHHWGEQQRRGREPEQRYPAKPASAPPESGQPFEPCQPIAHDGERVPVDDEQSTGDGRTRGGSPPDGCGISRKQIVRQFFGECCASATHCLQYTAAVQSLDDEVVGQPDPAVVTRRHRGE